MIFFAPQFALLFDLASGALHGAGPAAAAVFGAIVQILTGELRKIARQSLVEVAQLIGASGGFEFLKNWKFKSGSFRERHLIWRSKAEAADGSCPATLLVLLAAAARAQVVA